MATFYTPARVADLVALVGAPRFGPYLAAANGDHRGALDFYVWNLTLSAAFHGPLAILEVAVRNALHRELTALFGANWPTDPSFIAAAQKILTAVYPPSPGARRATVNSDLLGPLAKLQTKLTTELRRKAGTPVRPRAKLVPTTDDIVAALDFGYWTSLLNRDVEPVLYAAGLYKAFPNAPRAPGKTPARGTIAGKLNDVRKFRNRVMHHEPLFNRISVRNDLRSIIDICRWTDICAGDWIEHHSGLDEILRSRFGPLYLF